jgi:hypothetical protein
MHVQCAGARRWCGAQGSDFPTPPQLEREVTEKRSIGSSKFSFMMTPIITYRNPRNRDTEFNPLIELTSNNCNDKQNKNRNNRDGYNPICSHPSTVS